MDGNNMRTEMLTMQKYLEDPCRSASIPYWKAVRISVPDHMKIVHVTEFLPSLLRQYEDEPYFRLKHALREIGPAVVPEGYSLCQPAPEVFADHINQCYRDIRVTAEEVRAFTHREVFCPELWLALRENQTGEIAATAIAELDREAGEGVLEWIQVSEGHRRRGLGSFLVRELLQRMSGTAEFATVSGRCDDPSNPEGLYRRCGFTGNDVWHVLRKI